MIEPTALDTQLLLSLNGDGGSVADFIMYWVSDRFVWIPLYLWLLYKVWRRVGLVPMLIFLAALAVAVALSDQTANLAKNYLSKLRPSHYEPLEGLIHTGVNGYYGGLYGTISAHAACSMAVAVMCASMLRKRWLWTGLMVWVAVVSYSRIYLGVHYPFDIFFGLAVGLFYGLICWKLYGLVRRM